MALFRVSNQLRPIIVKTGTEGETDVNVYLNVASFITTLVLLRSVCPALTRFAK